MKIVQYANVVCSCRAENVEPKAPEGEKPKCGRCQSELPVDESSAIVLDESSVEVVEE